MNLSGTSLKVPSSLAEAAAHNARVAAGKKSSGAVALKAHTSNAAPGGAVAAKQNLVDGLNVAPGVRIRQDSKPLLNGLEQEWFNLLKAGRTVENLSAQALRFKLANGAFYKADIVGWVHGRLTAWECKGGKKMKGIAKSNLTMKVAAQQWPMVSFILVWKDNGGWCQQLILP